MTNWGQVFLINATNSLETNSINGNKPRRVKIVRFLKYYSRFSGTSFFLYYHRNDFKLLIPDSL